MILLSARDLSRQFDADPVFSGLGLEVRGGERIGLVGPNGSGKTTLLRILAGLDDPDTGVVETPNRVRVALLEQSPEIPAERTLWEEAALGLGELYALREEAETLAARMGEAATPEVLKRYDEVHAELEQRSAFQLDYRVAEVLEGLGFSSGEYSRRLSSFSGGQQARAALARNLLTEPDLMLLDEPTNHLDIATIEWLESYLVRAKPALLLVSHDRFFLDRVVNRILELRPDRLDAYQGNFTAYRLQREDRQQRLRKQARRQQEFVARTEDYIRKNRYGQKHRQAADRVRKLARVDDIELLDEFDPPPMDFGQPARSGDLVLEAVEIAKGFDTPLFEGLSLRVERGQRLGILGPNGSGKTTLLRTLLGELEADEGTVRLGAGVEVAYSDQGLTSIPAETELLEAVRPPGRPEITPGTLRSLLARFGLRGEIVFQPFGSASGGERSKTALARMAAQNANLLVLDEPTNHLDIWACDGLEAALVDFEGTVLFVTHDRYFIDQVATHVLVIEADRCRLYEGNYSGFLAFHERNDPAAAEEIPVATRVPRPPPVASPEMFKFPYRKVADIEEDIAAAEQSKEWLETELADPDVHRDGERMQQVKLDYEEVQAELERLLEHWEEASGR